jgi:hypothetical protein
MMHFFGGNHPSGGKTVETFSNILLELRTGKSKYEKRSGADEGT